MGISGVDQASPRHARLPGRGHRLCRERHAPDRLLRRGARPDEIEAVGPGGTFIDRDHTAEHFRKELYFPRLLDRNFYQAWARRRAKSIEQRCTEYKEEKLKTHQVQPIPADLEKELDRITKSAKTNMAEKTP